MANKSGRGNAISGLGKAVSEAGAWQVLPSLARGDGARM